MKRIIDNIVLDLDKENLPKSLQPMGNPFTLFFYLPEIRHIPENYEEVQFAFDRGGDWLVPEMATAYSRGDVSHLDVNRDSHQAHDLLRHCAIQFYRKN